MLYVVITQYTNADGRLREHDCTVEAHNPLDASLAALALYPSQVVRTYDADSLRIGPYHIYHGIENSPYL